jgi:periplasmic protein TonB
MATNDIHPPIETEAARPIEIREPEPELNLLRSQDVLDVPLWKSLFSGIDSALFPKKQAPLVLTSKPLDTAELWGDKLERPWWKSVFDNIAEALKSQGPVAKSSASELDAALARPWYQSIIANIQDALFPKKLPPLELTSKPVPVRDIWGFYDNKRDGALVSTAVHAVMIGLLIGGTLWARHHITEVKVAQGPVMPLLNDSDIPALPPSKTQVGGGGGGGDRDKLQATKGKLPKFAMQQITPPMVVVRNENPKLTAEPTVVVPPEIKLAMNNLPNLGDPQSAIPNGPLSNGTGTGGGIGSGSGGGVGSGKGPGVGPGEGGGIGGGVFHVGGGVSAPRLLYEADAEFSEEARKVKHQGTVVLAVVVGPDGRTRDIRVVNSLGMGLDEKAIEAVSKYRFDPARKDGKPVAVQISVEVEFRLY